MNFTARKLVLHSHSSWCLGSRLVNLNVPTISIRHVYLFDRNGFLDSKVTSQKQDDAMFQPHSLSRTTFFRYKSRKSNRGIHENNDDENSDDDSDSDTDALKSDRTLSLVKVQSLRLDSLIKGALGIPKNKIEKMFYKNQLRLNGKKLTKKSYEYKIDDVIDIVHEVDEENSNLLIASRIEVTDKKVNMDNGQYHITVRKFKRLKIENYSGSERYAQTE